MRLTRAREHELLRGNAQLRGSGRYREQHIVAVARLVYADRLVAGGGAPHLLLLGLQDLENRYSTVKSGPDLSKSQIRAVRT